MNRKKGFTILELLAVMTILLVMAFFGVRTFTKTYEKNRMKSFLSEALIISEGAKNRYQDDRLNDNHVYDLFAGVNENKSCYTYESALKDRFVRKYSSKYVGSVEVCHELDCDYQTKIWLTNGEYYLNGVITDETLELDVIDDEFSSNNYLSCGVNPADVNLEYAYDFSGSQDILEIIKDGVYSLEAWGAQGGRYGETRGGYGGYSYTEVELHAGDKLYIQVGGQGGKNGIGTKGGYNGGANGQGSGGGGATTIATKPGFIYNPILIDYVYIIAGGGGGVATNCCCCGGIARGYNGGGYCSERLPNSGTICQSGHSYGKATVLGGGGGYRAQSSNVDGNIHSGGSGYIGNPLTHNGWMSGYNVPESSDKKTKTISTTNVSDQAIQGYAKQGNGYARIKLVDDYYIDYNLNGGTVSTPNRTTYSKTTNTFTLNNPTKTFYTFTGWTGSNGSTPSTSVSIAKGSTGNKSYTAVYEKLYNVTLDYNVTSYTLPGGTSYMDSGFTPDWNNNFVIDMDINIPTSGKRYLIIGNYDTSNQINLEVNDANKLRAYQGGDKATSGAITIGEDANYIFTYTASDKSFTYTYTSTSTDISKQATLTSSGYSGATLRLGHDYRSKSTFTAYTLNGLKVTSLLAMSYLPTNVTRPGYTFDGWYTSATGGNRITNATVPSGEQTTYYAHWTEST